MADNVSGAKPLTPDDVLVNRLGPTIMDEFVRLDRDVSGHKNWRHFGEALLDLSEMELTQLQDNKPSLAIINKWMAKNPDGCVRQLVEALEEIERADIVAALREAIKKSRAFKKGYDRSISCPSKQSPPDVAALSMKMKQQSLDDRQLPQTSGERETASFIGGCDGRGRRMQLSSDDSYHRAEQSTGSSYVSAESSGHAQSFLCTPRLVITLPEVHVALNHLLSEKRQLCVRCEVYDSRHTLIATSSPGCVLRDISLTPDVPNPCVPVGTIISLCITVNRPCYLYIINIGTSGKEILLLPNDSRRTIMIQDKHIVGSMKVSGPTGRETIKVVATSSDLAALMFPAMRDISMVMDTPWEQVLWGDAEVAFTVVSPAS